VKLFEYQAKKILKEYGIPVPPSLLARNVPEAIEAAKKIGYPVALKAQVLAGGRGKAGGVSIVDDDSKLEEEARRILSLSISGEKPSAILVEKAVRHGKEYYLSLTLDRGERSFVLIASPEGGVDVESLATKIVRKIPNSGLDDKTAEEVASFLSEKEDEREKIKGIVLSLEKMEREKECELAEVNPLCMTENGPIALDAKLSIDDNALFRHPEFLKLHPEDEFEGEASRQGFAFVRLEGNIAVIGNGAGLVLSTLDLVTDAGGSPACFLDLGGGAQRERVESALKLVNKLPNVDRILVNIFGGITRTTDVAEGILSVSSKVKLKPLFARISGAEEEEARKILERTDVRLYTTASEAVEAVVKGK
jgi:succinyl-CoA synthetase beta subunit